MVSYMDGPLYCTVALFLCMTGHYNFYYVGGYVCVCVCCIKLDLSILITILASGSPRRHAAPVCKK